MHPDFAERCRLWEERLLVLLIYAIPLHEVSKNILWGVTLCLVIVRSAATGGRPGMGRIGATVGFWILTGIWAAIFSIEPKAGWKGLWDMVRCGAMFWIVADVAEFRESRVRWVRHLILSAALAAVAGWVEYLRVVAAGTEYLPKLHLQLPSVGHFNQSGTYLAMIWLGAVAAVIDGRVFSRGWMGWLAATYIGLSLLGTTSRTAIAMAGTGTLLLLWKLRPSRQVAIWLLAGVVTAAALVAASPNLRGRLLFRGSYSQRAPFWVAAWDAAKERPWTGVGPNNFKHIALVDPSRAKAGSIDHAHNLYFNTLAQMGIPGMAALLLLLAATGARIWRAAREPGNGREVWIYAAGGAWWIIVMAGMGNTTLHHEMGMVFFATMGLAAGAIKRQD